MGSVPVWRVERSAIFSAFRQGQRRRSGMLTVTWVEPGAAGVSPTDPPRVAYSVGRKVGSAVVRNRLRRRLRAIVRELPLEPGAYLVGTAPGAELLSYDELRTGLSEAMAGLRR